MAEFAVESPGSYTLYLWPREDGVRLDRLILTNDVTYYLPLGPSPREDANTVSGGE